MKESSVGLQGQYLSGKIWKVLLERRIECWAFVLSKYIQEAVKNVKNYLSKWNKTLTKRVKAPLTRDYHPEVNLSTELNTEDAAYFQSLIGILHWIIELGRVDVCCEVSMLLSCLVLPREGHLQALFHI